jgi:hypothetical protein
LVVNLVWILWILCGYCGSDYSHEINVCFLSQILLWKGYIESIKLRNSCRIFGSLKERDHTEDSDRVVKMDHGDMG